MAQNEDDVVQCHRDMCMAMLTKSIESTERLVIELKMKMYDRMGVESSETHNLMVINLLMEKLEQLNAYLASMVLEVRLTNPIVGNVLDNARKAMGLVSTANGNDVMGLVTTVNGNMGRLKCDGDKRMGMPKCDEDYANDEDVAEDEDFVEEVVNDLDKDR